MAYRLSWLLVVAAAFAVCAQSADVRIPSLLEVSAKMQTGAPADQILERLMKVSHNLHTDLNNDKTHQNEIRLSCQEQQGRLNSNLVEAAEGEARLEGALSTHGRALNASKKEAGGDLDKIQKIEKRVNDLSEALPESAKRIRASKARLSDIDRRFLPEEQNLGQAVNKSKELYAMLKGTFDEVAKLGSAGSSLLEVGEGARVGWASELTDMVDKMTTHLEELHENSMKTLDHKRKGALRDIDYQQSKVKTVSLKLNRTRHKLLKIQSRMDAAEVKIANLTTEMSKERFLLNRAKNSFRRATTSLAGSREYCKNTESQYSVRSAGSYKSLEKVNALVDIVQQRVDAIRRVLVSAEKIRSHTTQKLGEMQLPAQADMEDFDPTGATGATGASAKTGASGGTGATGMGATRL